MKHSPVINLCPFLKFLIKYSPLQIKLTFWSFPNEMAFFKWSWQRVKVLPRPWASKSKLSMIRPLKWGTLRLWTLNGFKMASRQSWRNKENVCFTSKTDFFSFFQLWRLAILKPVGVHRHNVPHFKGLIMLNLDFEAQGHGSTFTLCHAHLKKAISLGKLQKGQFFCKGLYLSCLTREIWCWPVIEVNITNEQRYQ